MPKLSACYAKKLPTGQYSNDSYSASIEVEIDETEPVAIQAGLRRLFSLVKDAVEQQFKAAWDPLESTCRHASLSIL